MVNRLKVRHFETNFQIGRVKLKVKFDVCLLHRIYRGSEYSSSEASYQINEVTSLEVAESGRMLNLEELRYENQSRIETTLQCLWEDGYCTEVYRARGTL